MIEESPTGEIESNSRLPANVALERLEQFVYFGQSSLSVRPSVRNLILRISFVLYTQISLLFGRAHSEEEEAFSGRQKETSIHTTQ